MGFQLGQSPQRGGISHSLAPFRRVGGAWKSRGDPSRGEGFFRQAGKCPALFSGLLLNASSLPALISPALGPPSLCARRMGPTDVTRPGPALHSKAANHSPEGRAGPQCPRTPPPPPRVEEGGSRFPSYIYPPFLPNTQRLSLPSAAGGRERRRDSPPLIVPCAPVCQPGVAAPAPGPEKRHRLVWGGGEHLANTSCCPNSHK